MNDVCRWISAAAVFACCVTAQANDPVRGQSKSAARVACHGPVGISPNPMFPHIAGQQAAYLQIQLEHFKTGERYHPLMTPIAQNLSEQDIADLAVYFGSIGSFADAAP